MSSEWMKIIMSIVGMTIAFVLFPTVLTGTASITGHTHITNFTGLGNVANIGPLVIFVGLVFGSAFSGYLGIKGAMKR